MGSSGSERPVIGLTTYFERARFGLWDTDAAVLHASYVDSVVRGGGVPVLLPPVADRRAEHLGRLDGLVLTGGADLDPGNYRRPAHRETGAPNVARDAAEFVLCRAALDLGIPLLGVCRGAQLLNVALGGTLHQHLPELIGDKAHQPSPGVFGDLVVDVRPGSRLAAIVGERLAVRCHHHQSIDELGGGLEPVAAAADGTIEAIELRDAPFVLGVQSHPEQNDDDVRLFAALVQAARQGSGG